MDKKLVKKFGPNIPWGVCVLKGFLQKMKMSMFQEFLEFLEEEA